MNAFGAPGASFEALSCAPRGVAIVAADSTTVSIYSRSGR